MSKATLLFAAILLAGCSREDQQQTKEDARKLGQDLKHDAKKADVVVTQEMKEAREKVQNGAEKLKQDVNKPKQQP
jgi:PBP1b-binding outer membrane lipoprotein LpoB